MQAHCVNILVFKSCNTLLCGLDCTYPSYVRMNYYL